jgi:hypothetical protein
LRTPETSTDHIAAFRPPEGRGPVILRMFDWSNALRSQLPEWYLVSPRSESSAHPWPLRLDPAQTPVFAHNELLIEAPAAKIFSLLTGGDWPRFYPNGEDVRIPPGPDGRGMLGPDTEFHFTTFGLQQRCRVYEYEQDRVLAWNAESSVLLLPTHAFHVWLLQAEGDATRVITEEIQSGPAPRLAGWLGNAINPSLHASHQLWLQGLKREAERTKID